MFENCPNRDYSRPSRFNTIKLLLLRININRLVTYYVLQNKHQ